MRSPKAVVYAAGPPRDRWTIGTLCAPSRRDVSSTRCPSNRSFRLYTKQHYQDQDIKDLKANARMTSLYVIAIHFKSDFYIQYILSNLPPSLSILSLQFSSSAMEQSLPAHPSMQSQRYSPFSSVHCP